jgi:hypothetical protein
MNKGPTALQKGTGSSEESGGFGFREELAKFRTLVLLAALRKHNHRHYTPYDLEWVDEDTDLNTAFRMLSLREESRDDSHRNCRVCRWVNMVLLRSKSLLVSSLRRTKRLTEKLWRRAVRERRMKRDSWR